MEKIKHHTEAPRDLEAYPLPKIDVEDAKKMNMSLSDYEYHMRKAREHIATTGESAEDAYARLVIEYESLKDNRDDKAHFMKRIMEGRDKI